MSQFTDPMADMLTLIRKGIKLKKVDVNLKKEKPADSGNHIEQLQLALDRIRKVCQSSEEEKSDEEDIEFG